MSPFKPVCQHEFVHATGLTGHRQRQEKHVILSMAGPKGGMRRAEAISLASARSLVLSLQAAIRLLEKPA